MRASAPAIEAGPGRSRIVLLPVLAAMASVAIGAVPRVALAAGVLPDALRPFVWSDILHIWERGVREGALPYWNVAFEYPPMIGYLWAALETLAASAVVHLVLWALVQAAAAGMVAFLLAREAGRARALLFWSLSPQLLLYGSLNFDVLAIAALVGGIVLARRGRVVLSAAALAVGTAAKLFPAAIVPVVLMRGLVARDGRGVAGAAVAFLFVLAAAFAPGAFAPFSTLGTLGRYTVGISPNIDSVWGLARAAVLATGWDPLAWTVVVSLLGMAVMYLTVVLRAAGRSTDVVAPGALAVLTVLLWTRLFSPQYTLWVLPFFALARLSQRTFAVLTAADVAVFLTVYPLTLVRRSPDDPFQLALASGMAAAVVLRQVALILTTREVWDRSRTTVLTDRRSVAG